MHIRRKITVSSLLLLLLLGGCRKASHQVQGGGIPFRIYTAGQADTKVGYRAGNGSETMDGSRVLLHWTPSDMIRITGSNVVCSESASVQNYQDYAVSQVNWDSNNTHSSATIAVAPSASGGPLEWDDADAGTTALYAVYPSPEALKNDPLLSDAQKSALSLGTNGRMQGYIPGTQKLSLRQGSENTYDAPMAYAYMGARASAGPGETVTFPFRPLFTAFEFTVMHSDAFPVTTLYKVRLYTPGLTLAGAFVGELTGPSPLVATTGTGEFIEADFTAIQADGISAMQGRPLVFTLIAIGCTHTELRIVFEGKGAIGTRSLLFKDMATGAPLVFEGCRRYRFGALSFPSALNVASGEEIDWNGMLNRGEEIDWDNADLNTGEKITWE